MSDSDNKQTGLVPHPAVCHQALVNYNRWRLPVLVWLMALVVAAGFWLMPVRHFIDSYQKITAAQARLVTSQQSLSVEVATLKGQVVGIVSGSIESKLASLEQSLRIGAINSSLGAIEDLRNDVKLLRTYTAEEQVQAQNTVANQQLLDEMGHLKRLIYMTIASCGLMLAAVLGIWVKQRKKLPSADKVVRFLSRY